MTKPAATERFDHEDHLRPFKTGASTHRVQHVDYLLVNIAFEAK